MVKTGLYGVGTVCLLFSVSFVAAQEIEVTMRVAAHRIEFLDPLFIEVTIVNKGGEPIDVTAPDPSTCSLSFAYHDSQSHAVWHLHGTDCRVGGDPKITLEPNKPVVVRTYQFLPLLKEADKFFWDRYLDDMASFSVVARYEPYPKRRVAYESAPLPIDVGRRQDRQTEALLQARENEFVSHDGVRLSMFNFWLNGFETSRASRGLAEQLDPGGLRDIVLLTALLQGIHERAPDQRDNANKRLARWLSERGIIEGRVLTDRAIEVAKTVKLDSTVEELSRIKWPE